jgi:CheY-like chemotaxis protein
VRVAVVDDISDLRKLLRTVFEFDERFEVVGEATNGLEAIDLADSLQPDLMILDRQMPLLGGVEAISDIRQRSPRTAVVVYTTADDAGTYQAALSAGALDMLDKSVGAMDFIDRLVEVLLKRWGGPDPMVEVRVGPVSSSAARVWVANTATILDAVAARPDVLGEVVPADVVVLFRSLLSRWGEIAEGGDEFHWVARASASDISRIIEYWAVIDRMTDEQLAALGIHWSPPEGAFFFQALTAGVLEALSLHEETQRLASMLSEQWASYHEDGGIATRQRRSRRRAMP